MSNVQAPKTEASAVRAIFDEHADFVWRVLARAGVRDADLRDATQDVFIVVTEKLSTREEKAAFTTWLYAISIRVAANHRRKAHHRREQLGEELPDVTRGSTPELKVADAEGRAQLATILGEMPPDQRIVFELFELEEQTCQSIADVLGIPLGTVYTRLRAARATFAKKAQQRFTVNR